MEDEGGDTLGCVASASGGDFLFSVKFGEEGSVLLGELFAGWCLIYGRSEIAVEYGL